MTGEPGRSRSPQAPAGETDPQRHQKWYRGSGRATCLVVVFAVGVIAVAMVLLGVGPGWLTEWLLWLIILCLPTMMLLGYRRRHWRWWVAGSVVVLLLAGALSVGTDEGGIPVQEDLAFEARLAKLRRTGADRPLAEIAPLAPHEWDAVYIFPDDGGFPRERVWEMVGQRINIPLSALDYHNILVFMRDGTVVRAIDVNPPQFITADPARYSKRRSAADRTRERDEGLPRRTRRGDSRCQRPVETVGWCSTRCPSGVMMNSH